MSTDPQSHIEIASVLTTNNCDFCYLTGPAATIQHGGNNMSINDTVHWLGEAEWPLLHSIFPKDMEPLAEAI